MDTIPLFHSNHSLLSILTLEDDAKKWKDEAAPSIFQCVLQDLKHKQLFLVDDTFAGFMVAYKKCLANNIQLIYGIRFQICADVKDKSLESRNTEARYTVFCRNGKGVKTLIKLYSEAATKHEMKFTEFGRNHRYKRIDFEVLKRYWNDEDLLLMPNFYDCFIHNNNLKKYNHIPDLSFIKNPLFELQDNELPIDEVIRQKTLEYCEKNGYKTQKMSSIYYRKKEEFKSYMIYKCILSRTEFDRPEMEFMSNDCFCVERFLEKNN